MKQMNSSSKQPSLVVVKFLYALFIGCKRISSEVRFFLTMLFPVPLLLLLYLAEQQGEDTRATHGGAYKASV